ncbi:MAG TPA: M48 family metallopeptidase [Thermoanaerobaculia bacterium]|nr:M48 family metallopeptidase [Thermoanaerobaculia bacterium]
MTQKWTRSLVAISFLLTVAIADAQTKIKTGFNLFSPEQDVEVGQQSAVEAEQQLPILNDAQINAYVNQIGQRLAANAGGPGFQYRFRVVNASDINAFALPGGFIYINRGVLDNARNEGEVAGVLAHEISHVALRHGTHQASKAYLAQAGISILGGLLGGKVGQGTAQVINAVGGFGLNALFLKYSRDIETQADVRGSQILTASGYTPVDMVNFFKTLERVDPSKKTNFLSDHPAPPDRIARIEREAQLLQVSDRPTENVAELRAIQSRLGSFGGARTSREIAQSSATTSSSGRRRSTSSQPVTVNVPAPSNSLSSYTSRSGVFRISYPSNWQVYESSSMGVTIAPPGGVGNVDGNSDIIYGALVNHYDPFGNQSYGNISLQEATQDLISEIQRTSPYLRLASNNAQQLRLAGGTALAATLRGTDPVTGINERVTVVTRQLSDEHLLYMLFITPEREASNYRNVLNGMVGSLQINASQPH